MIKRVNTKILELGRKPVAQYWLLIVITIIAAALRFYKLGAWSFWGDEMITVRVVNEVFNGGLIPTQFLKRGLSLMLIGPTLTLLGTSEWSARLVPALIGVISIPAFYFPIRKMFGPAVALLAGLLLAVSPWHLYWSQNARYSTMLLLFYTLALLTFYFGIEEDRPWYLLLSLFFLGLAVMERLMALFFVPVVVSYLALLRIMPFEKPAGLRLRNLVVFFLPSLFGALFLALPYLQQAGFWQNQFGQFFGWTNNNPFWILAGVVYYVTIPTFCFGILGGLYLLVKKNRAALLLSLGALLPLLAIMVISLFFYTANRYVFVSLTSLIILASVAAKELFWQTPKSVKLLAAGAWLMLLLMPLGEDVLYYKYQNGNRDNWRGAFALIKQQKKADDLVVTGNPLLGDYYLQEKTSGMERLDLTQIEGNENRVWFVEDMTVEPKWPQVVDWLQQNAQLVATMDVHVQARNFKMRVYIYDPDKPQINIVSR